MKINKYLPKIYFIEPKTKEDFLVLRVIWFFLGFVTALVVILFSEF